MKKIASICHTNHVICPPLALLAFLLAPAAGFAQQQPNELKLRVLAQAQAANPNNYAFTRTIRNEMTSGEKTEKKTTIEKFDPTKPAGQQWMLVSIDGAPPSTDA